MSRRPASRSKPIRRTIPWLNAAWRSTGTRALCHAVSGATPLAATSRMSGASPARSASKVAVTRAVVIPGSNSSSSAS